MKRSSGNTWGLMKWAFIAFFISLLVARGMSSNPIAIAFGISGMIASASFGLFCWGTLPFRQGELKDKYTNITRVGILGLILGIVQIPVWMVIASGTPREGIPPLIAVLATMVVSLSIVLPMFPRFYFFIKLKPPARNR